MTENQPVTIRHADRNDVDSMLTIGEEYALSRISETKAEELGFLVSDLLGIIWVMIPIVSIFVPSIILLK